MRRLPGVIAACSAALFAPLLFPLVTGRVFTLDDLGAYHIPFRFLYSTALHNGDSILWTPAVFAGYYAFGEGQIGMAHPWHLLLYRFLPLVAAVNLEIVTSYAVMFAGVALLLKRLHLSTESRWFGAMVFTFSGYNVFHLIHLNIIAAVAHIPWLLLATDALVVAADRKTRARAFIALTMIFASQILVGHTQHVWLGLLLVAFLCLYFLWNNVAIHGIALVVVALALGVLVASVQVLPLLDVVSSSRRTDWAPYVSLTFSLMPVNVVQLWSPFVFENGARAIAIERLAIHEFIVYNGAFCTVALAWIAVRWKALRRKHAIIGLLLLASVALLLAFGGYGGLYTTLLPLPGLRWFRAPARHLLIFHLALSVLAAIVFDDLVDLARRQEVIDVRRLWPLTIPCALSVGTMLVASRLIASGSREPLSAIAHTTPWLALFVLVPVLFMAAARGRRWALPLLVLVAAVDQGYWGFQYVFGNPDRPLMTIDELAARAETPDAAKPGDLIATRWNDELQNVRAIRGMRVWPGYVGLVPALALRSDDTDLVTPRIAGAKWRITESAGVQPIQDGAGRARLLTKVRVSSNVAEDVESTNILDEALVERPIDGLSGDPGSVRILDDRPGRIVVEATAPGRQLLVVTERFDRGWRVTEEGVQRNPPVRVYGDFLGYVIEAGTHRVTFRFWPRSFQYGLWMTGVGLAIVLCLVPFAI